MSTVFFTGHLVDRPGRATPRFPPSLAPQIARRIAGELEIVGATDGFASGACGGDIIFLEAIMARGGRAHITLPCTVDAAAKTVASQVLHPREVRPAGPKLLN